MPEEVWRRRQRVIVWLLFLHAIVLALIAVVRGSTFAHALLEAVPVGICGMLGASPRFGRAFRSLAATFGMVTSSAVLVHLTGGIIEAHFHFFVVLGVISLYQSWQPFLLALGYVVVHHGVVGVLQPTGVYNHAAAWNDPWRWAAIHGGFVLAASAVQLIGWTLGEQARRETTSTLSLLAATLESTADGLLVVDRHGRFTSYNHTFAEMWGIPDEILSSGDDDRAMSFVLDQLADPEGFARKVGELYADPEGSSNDVVHFLDGRVFERYSQPQYVDGIAVGRVWSFRDVTERRRLDEMKDGFLSAVSHELRTPLTSVVGYAATLRQRDRQLDEEQRDELLGRLDANARKLQRLLTDILDLDRLARGILEPRRQPTDLRILVAQVVAEAAPGRRVDVDAGGTWLVDAAKVERIVENLLTNAMRHGGEGTRIWIRTVPERDGFILAVDDDGDGVPDAYRASIFEAFSQGPAVRAHAPGVGIGLALVARFAELHGGSAWVEEREGGGASFRVRFTADRVELGSVV